MKIKLDQTKMRERCLAPEHHFWDEGEMVPVEENRFYVFKDNNAPVLFVGHLDSHSYADHFYVNRISGGHLIMAAQLDDRLGVHIGLDILPRLGVKTDILLTTDEEKGGSTSEYFVPTKQYNWIVEFDRMEEEVVLYGFGWNKADEWKRAIESVGYKIGTGSASDISKMEGLGCKAMNIGIGYYNYHSVFASAWWPTTVMNLRRFVRFYRKYKDVHFPHEKYVYVAPKTVASYPEVHIPYHPIPEPKKDRAITVVTTNRKIEIKCPSCREWVDKQEVDSYGACLNCSVKDESLEFCPGNRHYVDAEHFSYRTGMCYECLLSRY